MSNPVLWEKSEKKVISLLSAELAERVVKVKYVKNIFFTLFVC